MYKDFLDWLNEEFPHHSEYDFDTKRQYQTWQDTLYKAWKAGYSQGCNQGWNDACDYHGTDYHS